ncbi:hypothetical protein SADUNF_Sadunf15G0002100 [Salix dunnii]|uniref:Pectinesterase inhibitor domain-containing protein n=1 Tax=Salix dunnii TaxID=1413687 RepID=A0A835JCR3_9ROSI|nr:hypothetical protein SADUNF_Sadunf15G0002100 [Salix dunnii]
MLCKVTCSMVRHGKETCVIENLEAQMGSDDDFIKISCEVTRYPDLCYKTLLGSANTIQDNPTQLANASL